MGLRSGAAALALVVLLAGCSDDGADDESSKQETPSPTATVDPGPNIEAQLKKLEHDALAVDPQAKVVDPRSDPNWFLDTLYHDEIWEAGRGTVFVPATLTVRFPPLNNREHAEKLLRMFKRSGFGSARFSDLADYTNGTVQKSSDFRCRFEPERGHFWLRCIPLDYYYALETDVVADIMSVYSDETREPDTGCWQITFPHTYPVEPPVVGMLSTGACDGPGEYRAYLNEGEGWKRVARAPSAAALGVAVNTIVCVPELRRAFALLCASGAA